MSKHVAVIGAGPGGYAAAFYAADLGLRVTLIDNEWLMVGSANFDIRSMRLNFELNILVRDPERAAELEKVLRHDFREDSHQVDPEKFLHRPRHQRYQNGRR
jgi:cardiolipin synthase